MGALLDSGSRAPPPDPRAPPRSRSRPGGSRRPTRVETSSTMSRTSAPRRSEDILSSFLGGLGGTAPGGTALGGTASPEGATLAKRMLLEEELDSGPTPSSRADRARWTAPRRDQASEIFGEDADDTAPAGGLLAQAHQSGGGPDRPKVSRGKATESSSHCRAGNALVGRSRRDVLGWRGQVDNGARAARAPDGGDARAARSLRSGPGPTASSGATRTRRRRGHDTTAPLTPGWPTSGAGKVTTSAR